MWESRLSGSVRGWVTTQITGVILWHRRETRRQTEKTNFTLTLEEFPAYSNPWSEGTILHIMLSTTREAAVS